MSKDVDLAMQKTKQIYNRRKVASVALCHRYAGLAKQEFRAKQLNDEYWINRTNTALVNVYSGVVKEPEAVGFFLAHAVEYGVYLELANDRKHEAIRPIVHGLYGKFIEDMRRIWQ